MEVSPLGVLHEDGLRCRVHARHTTSASDSDSALAANSSSAGFRDEDCALIFDEFEHLLQSLDWERPMKKGVHLRSSRTWFTLCRGWRDAATHSRGLFLAHRRESLLAVTFVNRSSNCVDLLLAHAEHQPLGGGGMRAGQLNALVAACLDRWHKADALTHSLVDLGVGLRALDLPVLLTLEIQNWRLAAADSRAKSDDAEKEKEKENKKVTNRNNGDIDNGDDCSSLSIFDSWTVAKHVKHFRLN